MTFIETQLSGVFLIDCFKASDQRGFFVKTSNDLRFKEHGIDFQVAESYYSISNKNVIRGMHFQLPPHDHGKLVYVHYGSISDVILDLRRDSETYLQSITLDLSIDNKNAVFIPRGCVHSFLSKVDNTITVYCVSTVYDQECDSVIKWDSFDNDWNIISKPIVSKWDVNLPNL
jgi:dTDP-4-dehydrorhamnose 3,5-epimerase/CDP-3, 6-dideoxy-D-glycero-D-glycero-4-hexulose-5-epimerase